MKEKYQKKIGLFLKSQKQIFHIQINLINCIKKGVLNRKDYRKNIKGRPSNKELFLEEKYRRLEMRVKLLEIENELLQ